MTIQTAGFLSLLFMAICLPSPLLFLTAKEKSQAADWAVLHSSRNDQRHVSSRGVVQTMLENIQPSCAFSPDMRPEDFPPPGRRKSGKPWKN